MKRLSILSVTLMSVCLPQTSHAVVLRFTASGTISDIKGTLDVSTKDGQRTISDIDLSDQNYGLGSSFSTTYDINLDTILYDRGNLFSGSLKTAYFYNEQITYTVAGESYTYNPYRTTLRKTNNFDLGGGYYYDALDFENSSIAPNQSDVPTKLTPVTPGRDANFTGFFSRDGFLTVLDLSAVSTLNFGEIYNFDKFESREFDFRQYDFNIDDNTNDNPIPGFEFSGTQREVILRGNYDFATIQVLSAVPEPASWAMMIIGTGLVGGALRRRRNSVKVTVAYA